MPDTRDWSSYNPSSVYYAVRDLAELAARLGSIVTHDRRGVVIDAINMAATKAPWAEMLTGVGAAVAIDSSISRRHNGSVKCTHGSSSTMQSGVSRQVAPPAAAVLGQEISFYWDSDLASINFALDYVSAGLAQRARARIRWAELDLQVYDETFTPVTIASIPEFENAFEIWHTFKLVANFATGLYKRIIFNGVSYDVSDTNIEQSSSSDPNSVTSQIFILGAAAANRSVWLNDYILTIDE